MSLIEDLHELFLIDQQVRGLSSGMNAAAAHVRAQQTKLDQLQSQLSELQQQLMHAKAAAANLESDAGGVESRIEKLREQMNAAKNNKEYSALLVEINTLKIDKGKIEEQALQHLTRADELKAQVDAMQEKVVEQEKLKAHADERLTERRAEVGEQLEQVKAKRESAARQLPSDVLSTFEKLCTATDGEALACVTQEHARADYHCDGCYMALPLERVNLLASTEQLVRCPSCGRYLFLESQVKEALSGG